MCLLKVYSKSRAVAGAAKPILGLGEPNVPFAQNLQIRRNAGTPRRLEEYLVNFAKPV
jgi:hypothetical protein